MDKEFAIASILSKIIIDRKSEFYSTYGVKPHFQCDRCGIERIVYNMMYVCLVHMCSVDNCMCVWFLSFTSLDSNI